MEKEEILKISSKKRALVGEMEQNKINKSNWIAVSSFLAVATILMIILGAIGNFVGLYAVAVVCFVWASVFYFCQYFIAKRPWKVLIGAILHSIGAMIMLTFFILFAVGVL